MINIFFNNQTILVENNISLLAIMQTQKIDTICYSIMLNQHYIPRSDYAKTILAPNDSIEIITPMQGG